MVEHDNQVGVLLKQLDDLGPADTASQAPLFPLEGHVTRNLFRAFWISLDALYTYGGETEKDDVSAGRQALGRSVVLKPSWGETVSRNQAGPEGTMASAILSPVF